MKHLPKEIIVNWKKEPQFGGNIIYMSPDEYIDRIHIKNKLSAKEILELEIRAKKAGLKGILYYPPESKTSQDYLKKAMLYGKALDMPWIEYDAQDKLRNQEGYNRALAAKKLGIKQIPIEIIKPLKGNGEKFIRLATKIESTSQVAKNKAFNSFPKIEGMQVVYKPYGEQGRGFYYISEEGRTGIESTPSFKHLDST